MHFLAPLTLLTATVLAQSQSSIFTTCDSGDFTMNGAVLTMPCTNDAGTQTTSSIDLNSCLANQAGALLFAPGGGFAKSCGDCAFDLFDYLVFCDCQTGTGPGVTKFAVVSLLNNLFNQNGILVCVT